MEHDATDDDGPLLGSTAVLAALGLAAALAVPAFLLLSWPAAAATALLALMMILITMIDARHFIIPDVLSLPAIPLGIVANIAVFHAGDWLAGLTESALGAAIAGGAFYLLRAGYYRLRGTEGLGLGDVKLAAAAGAWLGPELLAPACLVAALGGLAAAGIMALVPGRGLKATDHLPFGSFIAPAILLFWAWRSLELVPNW